jgi:hypothetical protein
LEVRLVKHFVEETTMMLLRKVFHWGSNVNLESDRRGTRGRKRGDKNKRRRNLLIPSVQKLERRDLLASFAVNTTDDTPDANLADTDALDANGNTSLRAAIMQANATVGEDFITLPDGIYTLTIPGTLEDAAVTGDLDVIDMLTITGDGSGVTVIDAADLDRVFHLPLGGVFNLTGVTIRNGTATDDGVDPGNFPTPTGKGGGLLASLATVTLTDVTVTANDAIGSEGSEGLGGGIYTDVATMTVVNSSITGNRAIGSAGAFELSGADGKGGGIFSDVGTTWLQVTNTTIANNQAIGGLGHSADPSFPASDGGSGLGGGIFSTTSTWGDALIDPPQPRVVGTTISGNQAIGGRGGSGSPGGDGGSAFGGGIYADLDTWSILNSTISTNSAIPGNGGAGLNSSAGGAAGISQGGGISSVNGTDFKISYTTVALNRALEATGGTGTPAGNPGLGQGGGVFNDEIGSFFSLATIFAPNAASSAPDASGTYISLGNNLVGNGGGSSGFTAPSDQVGTGNATIDPLLGPLQNNGGPTETHLLLFGSPAIDRANNANAPPNDQRGVIRPIDGDGNGVAVADVGAVEVPFNPPTRIDIQKYVKKAVAPPVSDKDLCDTIGKPLEVTFRYSGGGPDATNTHQPPGKFSVTGDPNDASPVFIRVSDSATASSTTTVFFSGTVLLGDAFTAKAANAGETRFASNTFIHIFSPGMQLLQSVQYHTSCSAPIVLGDVIGGVTLVGVVGETGSASLPPPPSGDLGEDADSPPGPTINLGERVTWTYVVTNPGGPALSNIVVKDDNETPGNPNDDFSPAPIVQGSTQFNVGDTNKNNQLEASEQWIYSATATVTTSGQHKNVGTATGTGLGATVSASDPAHFLTPGPCVNFSFEGSSATSGQPGNTRLFTLPEVSVKTSGFSRDKSTGAWESAYLGRYSGGLGVTDSSEGSGANNSHTVDNIGRNNYVLFEFSKSVMIDQAFLGYVVGDSDLRVWIGNVPTPFASKITLSDPLLNSFAFTEPNLTDSSDPRWADLNAGNVSGNILVIAALPEDDTPEDRFKIAKLKLCTAGSSLKAAIDIKKATNGFDADTPIGPILTVNSKANFTYAVRNFGSVPLTQVAIKDDNGTPSTTSDDFVPTASLSGGFNVGDLNKNNQLDLTEVWQYTASRTVTLGQYSNLGKASAKTTDGRSVSDTDPSHHFGVAAGPKIDIEKFVRGTSSQPQPGVVGELGVDADTPNGPTINIGQTVVWTYRVVNIGNQPLRNVVVTDDRGTPGNTADDFAPPAITVSGKNVGDLNRNDNIDQGESWYYRAVDTVITDSLYGNIGKVTAKTISLTTTVSDSDAAYYLGAVPVVDTRTTGQKPQVLVMRYTGDNVISTSQSPGKVSASGNLNGATKVRILATDKSKANDGKALVYFDGQVSVGQNFAIDAGLANKNRLENTTYVHIFNLNGDLLRTIRFDTSGSQPLVLNDRFGGIKLVGFVGENGAKLGLQLPSVIGGDVGLKRGQTATIGYWQNNNGQALILSLNGGANSTSLGNWLATNLPNMYGASAGANNLAGKTNQQVAAYYITLFKQQGQKLNAQVLATAFAVYVTDSDLAGNNAVQYGFIVNSNGTGAATFSVGSSGAAFGVANNTRLTVLQFLKATNAQTVGGNLYNGSTSLRNLANTIYDGINQGGDIY